MTLSRRKTIFMVFIVLWGLQFSTLYAVQSVHLQPAFKDDITLSPASIETVPGEMTIHWTAPGDDGNNGTADHYIIKCSSTIITELNWGLAPSIPNPPLPLPAGSIQSFTFSGLNRGAPYYLAIKTYDRAGNVSVISNVIRKFAGGLMTPNPRPAVMDSVQASATLKADTVGAPLPIKYQFALDFSSNFSNPSISADSLIDSLAMVTYTGLNRAVKYYWHCRVMARDLSDSSLWSRPDSFVVPSSQNDNPLVTVGAPNGSEIWDIGSAHNIIWTDSDVVGGIASHKLEYSADSGATWLIIRDWTTGDPHTFAWTVPPNPTISAKIRISCRDAFGAIGSDLSNANFTIRDNTIPTLTLINPNGGQNLRGFNTYSITWTDNDNVGVAAYKLEYSIDAGTIWTMIADWTSGDPHRYNWIVPNVSSRTCRVRVSVRDTFGNMANARSNRNFRIRAGNVFMSKFEDETDEEYETVPSDYVLGQSYPNPFNGTTTIAYGLPEQSHVSIEVYDITGRRIEVLVDNYQEAGYHKITWNSGNQPSGTYFYRIETGTFSETKKMMVIK